MREADRTGKEQSFGPHSLRYLEPTLAVCTFRDPLRAVDIYPIVDVLRASLAREGRLFFLVDVTAVTVMPLHTRGFVARAVAPYSALAMVGASFPVRVTSTMIIRAARLLDKERFGFPFEFFKTEAEGLAWLRERAGASGQKNG